MNIKLFKLSDIKLTPEVIKADNSFINDLNDSLFDDDYTLDPHARNYLFPVVMVESDQFESSFKKIKYFIYRRFGDFVLIRIRVNKE